ncbi:GNAT family N-acetyltransferase [Chitinimonas naiadis]
MPANSPLAVPVHGDVSLRPLSHDNFKPVIALNVRAWQTGFVATNENTIAKAYLDHEHVLLRVVYAEETPVGLLAFWCHPGKAQFHLLRFMIGSQYQGYGYGQAAMQLLQQELYARHGSIRVTLYYREGKGSPRPFYEKLGFVDTGEKDGDEFVMAKRLGSAAYGLATNEHHR